MDTECDQYSILVLFYSALDGRKIVFQITHSSYSRTIHRRDTISLSVDTILLLLLVVQIYRLNYYIRYAVFIIIIQPRRCIQVDFYFPFSRFTRLRERINNRIQQAHPPRACGRTDGRAKKIITIARLYLSDLNVCACECVFVSLYSCVASAAAAEGRYASFTNPLHGGGGMGGVGETCSSGGDVRSGGRRTRMAAVESIIETRSQFDRTEIVMTRTKINNRHRKNKTSPLSLPLYNNIYCSGGYNIIKRGHNNNIIYTTCLQIYKYYGQFPRARAYRVLYYYACVPPNILLCTAVYM